MKDLLIAALLFATGVAWNELRDWLPWIAKRIVLNAAKNVGSDLQQRMAEEWSAELAVVTGKISPLFWACNLWWGTSKSKLVRSTHIVFLAHKLLAAFLIFLLSPTLLLIAFLVFRQDGGPTLYAHYRVGKGGKLFRLLKFRTAYIDADQRLQQYLESHPDEEARLKLGKSLSNDPRFTKFGIFMRKTGLDELPVFFNILRGEMDFVGPRPRSMNEIAKGAAVSDVRPGLIPSWNAFFRELPSIFITKK